MALEDHYGDILQKARSGAGWSVEDLAEHAALSPEHIRIFEAGAPHPSLKEVRAVAKLLKLDASHLAAIAEERWLPDAAPPSAQAAPVQQVVGSIGGYAVNSYLYYDRKTGEAAAIDTANAPEKVLDAVRSAHLHLTSILLTHTHPDHVGGVERLVEKTGARLVAHPLDQPALGSLWNVNRDCLATEGSSIKIGNVQLEVRWVPGHTHSGVCYLGEGVVFVGDCLFAGSVGRARSPSDHQQLLDGIKRKLLTLSPATTMYPGHGPLTTVGEEQEHNPFFG